MYQITSLKGSADALAEHLDERITSGSASASIEHKGELKLGDARMVLRTYERYSLMGGNRVTLSVSILAVGDAMEVALTTSGGSQAVFLKVNTVGEETFMQKALEAVGSFGKD